MWSPELHRKIFPGRPYWKDHAPKFTDPTIVGTGQPAWVDHTSSFMYYGTFGLLDPKMPFEAKGYQKAFNLAGWRGFALGAGISMTGGFLLAGAVGWAFDPKDKRKGGIVEWKSYQKHVDPHVQNTKLAYHVFRHYFKSRGHRDYYFM